MNKRCWGLRALANHPHYRKLWKKLKPEQVADIALFVGQNGGLSPESWTVATHSIKDHIVAEFLVCLTKPETKCDI